MKQQEQTVVSWLFYLTVILFSSVSYADKYADYDKARWNEIHQKPAIDKASNQDCLVCHQEITDRQLRETSPAGVKKSEVLAWYQTLDVYKGEQMTFHQRHLTGPLAKELMDMKCSTCHQGNDLREESIIPPDANNTTFTQRKSVNPEVCLMCHGQMDTKIMSLPGPWSEHGKLFNNDCLTCHAAFRTNRHQVNFLKAEAIEKSAKENKDTCFGCHGGRSWYRIPYPYPRHKWDGMPPAVPEWAKDRPTKSKARFILKNK